MRQFRSLAILIMSLVYPGVTLARPAARLSSLAEYQAHCREHRQATVTMGHPPRVGQITFLPTLSLEANQDRFSFISVQRKLKKALKNEPDAYIHPDQNQWVFPHDQGQSFYPESKAIQALFYRGKVYVLDGHHRAAISTYLGARSIPVFIKADLSDLYSPAQFERYLAEQHFSYFQTPQGMPSVRVDLCEMVDDPNLQLARLLFARTTYEWVKGDLKIEPIQGDKWIIGVKTPTDIPFLEFEVADALYRQGVRWNNTREQVLRRKEVETFASLLQREAQMPNSRLSQLMLFAHPTKLEDVDLKPLLHHHLKLHGCADALAHSPIP